MKSLRKKVMDVIISCTNIEQMKGAYNYMALAGLDNDPIMEELFELKLNIIGNI
jgi:hypothetical protein